MKIKRVLQGTALTALAAAAWMGAGSTDASAAIKTKTLSKAADGSYQLNVTADTTDIEIMAAVVKPNKNGGVKITAWDVYEGNTANIDVSKLNVANDNYIALKTDSMTEPVFVGIAASSKKNKIEFNAGSATITKVDASGTEYKDPVEYRTANGNWTSMSLGSNLSNYQYQGATLYLRLPADSAKKTGTLKVKDITLDKNNSKEIDVDQVGSLPTKEVKLNIAKQANGPKVAVNYVKGTLTLPKGSEWRLVANGVTNAAVGHVDAKDKAQSVTPGGILGIFDKGVLEVRKAAVTEKKGKAASKWSRVELNKPVAFNGTPATNVTTGDAVTATVSGTSIKLNYTKNKKEEYTKGLVIDATATKFDMDYVIGDIPADGKGIKTIKAGKKVTLKNLAENAVIRVRVAGNKKDPAWPGEWGVLYTVNLPK